MADFDIPADLIQLRRDFEAASAAWAAATGQDATQRAYEETGRLAEAIHDHPWWGTVDGYHSAHMALIAAVKQAETPSP